MENKEQKLKAVQSYKRSFCFLPWLNLDKNIEIGPVEFWPYFKDQNREKIADPKVKDYLDWLFSMFVDHKGKPVETITMCSYDGKIIYDLTDSLLDNLIFATDLLVFASIIASKKSIISSTNNNSGWNPPSSEFFKMFCFPLPDSLDDKFATFRVGNSANVFVIDGSFKFHMPLVPKAIYLGNREELIVAFDKYANDISRKDQGRVFQSLKWFRLAHFEDESLSDFSKIVMIATAFESLLDFPGVRKKAYFMDYMKEHIVEKNFVKAARKINDNKDDEITLAEWWAYDFYELRNSIVHGDNVPPERLKYNNKFSHIDIANIVFYECMIDIILGFYLDEQLVAQ